MCDRFDVSHGSTAADNRDPLPLVLDGVEQFGKISRCIGGTNFCHEIILSDSGVGGPTQPECNLSLAPDLTTKELVPA